MSRLPVPRSPSPPVAPRARLRLVDADGCDDTVRLVAAAQAGDGEAAARIWDRYHAMVRGILARSLGSDADVEDDTQEVFLRLFPRLGRLEDPADPECLRRFIVGITMRVLRRRLSRQWFSRWLRFAPPAQLPPAVDGRVDPEACAALQRLYEILAPMKPRLRLAFTLRHIEGLTLPEVAASLGISLAAAKRTLVRAQARVDRAMQKDALLSPYARHVQR